MNNKTARIFLILLTHAVCFDMRPSLLKKRPMNTIHRTNNISQFVRNTWRLKITNQRPYSTDNEFISRDDKIIYLAQSVLDKIKERNLWCIDYSNIEISPTADYVRIKTVEDNLPEKLNAPHLYQLNHLKMLIDLRHNLAIKRDGKVQLKKIQPLILFPYYWYDLKYRHMLEEKHVKDKEDVYHLLKQVRGFEGLLHNPLEEEAKDLLMMNYFRLRMFMTLQLPQGEISLKEE